MKIPSILIACGALGGAFFPALLLGALALQAIRHAAKLPAPSESPDELPAATV